MGTRRAENYDIPEEAFFIKDRFKLLIDRSLNVEESEDTSDIKEENSHDQVFPWTNPVRQEPYGEFQRNEG